jgi:hypothetical protein
MLKNFADSLPKRHTKEDIAAMLILVADLMEKPDSPKKTNIINNARNLVYSNYGSELTFPKTQLHKDLIDAGYSDLVEKMEDGVYDS